MLTIWQYAITMFEKACLAWLQRWEFSFYLAITVANASMPICMNVDSFQLCICQYAITIFWKSLSGLVAVLGVLPLPCNNSSKCKRDNSPDWMLTVFCCVVYLAISHYHILKKLVWLGCSIGSSSFTLLSRWPAIPFTFPAHIGNVRYTS